MPVNHSTHLSAWPMGWDLGGAQSVWAESVSMATGSAAAWTIISPILRPCFSPAIPGTRNTPRGDERASEGLRGRGGAAESQARKGRPSPGWCWRPVRPLNTDASAFISDRRLSANTSDALTSTIFTLKADRQASIARTDRESRGAAGASSSCGSPAPDRPGDMGNTPAAKRGNEMESGECL